MPPLTLLFIHSWASFYAIAAALAAPGIVSSSWRCSAAAVRFLRCDPVVYYQMAEFDILTRQTTFASELQQAIPLDMSGQLELADVDSLGHAAIRAYTAYKNPIFLNIANQTWTYARDHTISAEAIAAGSLPAKDVVLAKTCQDATMLGGTFINNNLMDSTVTGSASAVSALLAEATSSPTYLTAASDSLHFIQSHLSSQTCTGLMMEGLATLAAITNTASTKSLLENIITATLTNAQWQTEVGIIAQGELRMGDQYIVRGITAAYGKKVISPELRTYVHDYLGVQFNAVIDLATSNGNNIYAGCWTGPPSASISQLNQTSAISTLLSAISLDHIDPTSTIPAAPSQRISTSIGPTASSISFHPTNPSSSVLTGPDTSLNPTSTATSPSVTSTAHRRKSPESKSTIIGAVVGSVVLVALGVGICFLLRRRARTIQRISSMATVTAFTRRATDIVSSPPTSGHKSGRPMSTVTIHRAPDVDPPIQSPTNDVTASADGHGSPDGRTSGLPATPLIQLPIIQFPAITELLRLLTVGINERLPAQHLDEERPPPEYSTREN
ncbi:hypothetical protein C8R43DRAFT_991622 [Mycena crocata]|nr:hypothetical protein C8R43DRAFT_991622 [Mycena crocata]